MNRKNFQIGQTLIETMVAVFILVMGVTAATGLAVYALGTSTNVTKQIIATGLAREGIEAVKNIRDTNWLQDSLSVNGCYNYKSSQAAQADCYKNWLTKQNYPSTCPLVSLICDINAPSAATNYVLGFTTNAFNSNYWILYKNGSALVCPFPGGGANNTPRYGLDFSANPATNNLLYGAGFYRPNCQSAGSSNYYRKIVLQTDASSPFDKDVGPKLIIKSQVWWTDKKCPPSSDWPGVGKCSLEIQTYLTNWKNY